MKTLILALGVSLLAAVTTARPQKSEPQFKLVEFHMALIKKSPNWTPDMTPAKKQLDEQQNAYVTSLLESGKAVIAGRLTDDDDIRGVIILRSQSAVEARTWAETAPAIKAGYVIAEMHSWWSEDIFKKPTLPLKLTQTYLAFLTRGAKWTPEKTAAAEELQKAHIANLVRLAKLGKIVAAGPFGDDGVLRGIFVFRVASLEEAQTLAATDPAVQAGRLAVDIHPWQVPEGVLP
jgi:uncharacterized protein YciI